MGEGNGEEGVDAYHDDNKVQARAPAYMHNMHASMNIYNPIRSLRPLTQ
jgi:hypothetical protein